MAEIIRLRPTRPCPICGKPSSQQYHPFCSARCADIDLNRWLSGSYVIPAEPVEDDPSDAPAKPGQREDDED
ncbi:MAG: DNA gyrase inhibitor YacG [Devosia sp.]